MDEASANGESKRFAGQCTTARDGLVEPPRILIVEDDPDVSQILGELLAHFGYLPTAACDGMQALSLWRDGLRPDVVLLDLVMPNMDGYRFRRAQKDEPAFASVPVIVISAQASPNLQSLDVQGYVKKPFDVDVLIAQIERNLRRAPRSSAVVPIESS
jgi:two-component system response regulator MprA